MSDRFRALSRCFSSGPVHGIDWEGIESDPVLMPLISRMKATPQDALFHQEGDVWAHTRLTCKALAAGSAFHALDLRKREILFTAALLHDIGKISHTAAEGGRIVSPGHAAAGARMARGILWTEFGLCGTDDALRFREAVCALIRFHSAPARLLDEKDWEYRIVRIASFGEMIPDFSFSLLCALEEADVRGRIAPDLEEMERRVRYAAELAAEAGCLEAPARFASGYTRFAYLSGRDVPREFLLFNDTWGEVTLLSGLPGTGKDTRIRECCPDMPVISLDEIRREAGILPTDPQGKVIDEALARARELLRKKVPFVWNATNISAAQREKPLSLFHAYHASARVIYLETGWDELLKRNQNRPHPVPEQIIRGLVLKTTPPAPEEAEGVEWICG